MALHFLHNLADRRKHAHGDEHTNGDVKHASHEEVVPKKHVNDNVLGISNAQDPALQNGESAAPEDTLSDEQLAHLLQEQENARGAPISKPIIRLSHVGHGLTIRPYHPSDAPALTSIANNKNISSNMTNRFPFPYRLQDAEEFIAKALHPETSSVHAWAVTSGSLQDGQLIGGIGLEPGVDVFAHTAEIGYWLAETSWGRGYATALCAAFTDWAFQLPDGITGHSLQRIGAGVFSANPASEKVLKAAGYKHEGTQHAMVFKRGEVRDLEIWGLTRREWEKRQKRRSTRQQLKVMEMAEGTMIGNVDARMEI